MMENCEKCKTEFQPWDKRFELELPQKKNDKAILKTVCFLCAVEILKETLEMLGVNVWRRSVVDLYRLLFPGTVSSFYLPALMKALEQLYLQNWADQPGELEPSIFW